MPFACPGCDAAVDARPERALLRCSSCGAWLRCRAVDAGGAEPAFEVEVAGRRETRRLVRVPWDERQRRRLAAWLLWSTVLTLALVLVLYVLARLRA